MYNNLKYCLDKIHKEFEQRAKEKWPNIEAAQEVPQVDLGRELSLENRMETMQSILSAA